MKEGKLGGWAREGVGAKVGQKVSKLFFFIRRKGIDWPGSKVRLLVVVCQDQHDD